MVEVEVRGGKNNPLRLKYGEKDNFKKMLENKELFLVSVCDMYIFDENENLVVKLNTLTDCNINMDTQEDYHSTIIANSCTFSFELFKFMNSSNKSDYKSFLESSKPETIPFKQEYGCGKKKCKVILVAEIRNNCGEKINDITYNFSNCFLRRKYTKELTSNGVSGTNIIIDVDADKNGNLFEMTF